MAMDKDKLLEIMESLLGTSRKETLEILADEILALVGKDEHCFDNVPPLYAFLNCDCKNCNKGKHEIAKRLWAEYCSKYQVILMDGEPTFKTFLEEKE